MVEWLKNYPIIRQTHIVFAYYIIPPNTLNSEILTSYFMSLAMTQRLYKLLLYMNLLCPMIGSIMKYYIV